MADPVPDESSVVQTSNGAVMNANSHRKNWRIIAHLFEMKTRMPGILAKEAVRLTADPLNSPGELLEHLPKLLRGSRFHSWSGSNSNVNPASSSAIASLAIRTSSQSGSSFRPSSSSSESNSDNNHDA